MLTDSLPLSPSILEDRRPAAWLGSLTVLTGGTCPEGFTARLEGVLTVQTLEHTEEQRLPAHPAAACPGWLLPAQEECIKAEKAGRDGAAQLQRSQKGLKNFLNFYFSGILKHQNWKDTSWQMKWLQWAPTGLECSCNPEPEMQLGFRSLSALPERHGRWLGDGAQPLGCLMTPPTHMPSASWPQGTTEYLLQSRNVEKISQSCPVNF